MCYEKKVKIAGLCTEDAKQQPWKNGIKTDTTREEKAQQEKDSGGLRRIRET